MLTFDKFIFLNKSHTWKILQNRYSKLLPPFYIVPELPEQMRPPENPHSFLPQVENWPPFFSYISFSTEPPTIATLGYSIKHFSFFLLDFSTAFKVTGSHLTLVFYQWIWTGSIVLMLHLILDLFGLRQKAIKATFPLSDMVKYHYSTVVNWACKTYRTLQAVDWTTAHSCVKWESKERHFNTIPKQSCSYFCLKSCMTRIKKANFLLV